MCVAHPSRRALRALLRVRCASVSVGKTLVCGAGLAMPRRLELPYELAEAFEIDALQPGPLGFGKGQRIDRLAVFDDLEMEMRAGGPPGTADEADHLSPMNLHTGADAGGKLGKVAVDRRDIVGVLDADPVSIACVRRRTRDR